MIKINKKYVNRMLLGSCLGDAGIEKARNRNKFPHISFCHNLKKEKDYINHKKDLLSRYYKVGKLMEDSKKNTIRFRMSSDEKDITTKIQKLTRDNDNKRTFPLGRYLKYIDEITLLYWYLDDGSLSMSKATNGGINRKLRIALPSLDVVSIVVERFYDLK